MTFHALRDYQREAVTALFDWFARHSEGHPIIGLPTGTGKSLVLAEIVRLIFSMTSTQRILISTHVAELIKQNVEELLGIWPDAPIGIHCASLNRKDTVQPIIFGSVQTMTSTIKRLGFNPFGVRHLFPVDECHLVPMAADSQYQVLFSALRDSNPYIRAVGLTASAYRLEQGMLTDPGGLFTDFAFDRTTKENFNQFIRDGYLAPLIPKKTHTEIDVSKVKITAGDFNAKQLEAASNVDSITRAAVQETIYYGAERAHWLFFTAGIDHCEAVAECLEQHGVTVDFVHSKRTKAENDKALADFKAGNVRALVNANKLTTGFNFPGIDLIAMLRATQSPIVHVQSLGRGTRPAPGKSNCLVLDFVRNTPRLGPINDPVLPRPPGKNKGGQPAPVKTCENCGVFNHVSARECLACLEEFGFTSPLRASAGTDALIAGLEPEPENETRDVHTVSYQKHLAKSGIPSLRVTYVTSAGRVTEFQCFDHPFKSFPHLKARRWWQYRTAGLNLPMPKNVDEAQAMAQHLREPKRLIVKPGKFPEIISHEF